jgi:hypothetical protein
VECVILEGTGGYMTNFLSMVFTGLAIIQPNGDVSAIKADEHKLIVRLDDRTFEVNESLSFEGLTAGEGRFAELSPTMTDLLSTRSNALQLDAQRILGFQVAAVPASLVGGSATCESTSSQPSLFQGVVWQGQAMPEAAVVIDGQRHALGSTRLISISNEFRGAGEGSPQWSSMSVLTGKANYLTTCSALSLR